MCGNNRFFCEFPCLWSGLLHFYVAIHVLPSPPSPHQRDPRQCFDRHSWKQDHLAQTWGESATDKMPKFPAPCISQSVSPLHWVLLATELYIEFFPLLKLQMLHIFDWDYSFPKRSFAQSPSCHWTSISPSSRFMETRIHLQSLTQHLFTKYYRDLGLKTRTLWAYLLTFDY